MTVAVSAPTPRSGQRQNQQLAHLLNDPKAYFAEARRWARDKARDDLRRELNTAARRRTRG